MYSLGWLLLTSYALLSLYSSAYGTSSVVVPVGTYYGVMYDLQYYATGVMVAAKSASSISFQSTLVSVFSGTIMFNSFSNAGYAAMLPVGTQMLCSLMTGNTVNSRFVAFGPLTEDYSEMGSTSFMSMTNYPSVYYTIPKMTIEATAVITYFTKMEQTVSLMGAMISNDPGDDATKGMWDILHAQSQYVGIQAKGNHLGQYDSSYYTGSVQPAKYGVVFMTVSFSYQIDVQSMLDYQVAFLTDPQQISRNVTFILDYRAAYLVWNTYQTMGTTKVPPTNIVAAFPAPGIDSTEYAASQAFAQLQAPDFASITDHHALNYVMAGWITALALIQALTMLASNNFNNNGAMLNFFENIGAAQSQFLVYDMVVGHLGTSCATMAVTQGVDCCQTGGRSVFFQQMTKVSSGYDYVSTTDFYVYPKGSCAQIDVNEALPNAAIIPQPFHVLGQAPTDNDMMAYMCSQIQSVIRLMSNTTLFTHASNHSFRMYCQETTMTNLQSDMTNYLNIFKYDALGGAVAQTWIGSRTSGFTLDFIPQTTQPALTTTNLFYLFPTLDQELYQLAAYVASISGTGTKICAVVEKSTLSGSIISLLDRTLTTFALAYSSADVVTPTSGTLAGGIPSGCTDTFAIGLGTGDVAALVTYLQGQPSSRIYVSFDDVTKYYSDFQSETLLQQAGSLANRMIFATNLPSWTATPSASASTNTMAGLSTYEEFLGSADISLHTPAALRSFFSTAMMDAVTSHLPNTFTSMINAVNAQAVWLVGGCQFGPYYSDTYPLDGTAITTGTATNYGATNIAVWSFNNVVAPSTPPLAPPSTPSLMYISATASTAVSDHQKPSEDVILTSNPQYSNGGVQFAATVSCIEQSSSMESAPKPTTTTTTTMPPTTTTRGPDSSSESRDSSSSGMDGMDVTMIVLAALGAILWLAVLIVWLCLRYPQLAPRSAWFARNPFSRIQSVCRRNRSAEDRAFEESHNLACTPQGKHVVLVVVDMPNFWQKWAYSPEAMMDLNLQYQKNVRKLIADYQSYEVRLVGGTFLIACPASMEAMLLIRSLSQHNLEAWAAELRVAVHTVPSLPRQDAEHSWWCGNAAAHTVLSICGLAEVGQVLATKDSLSALDESDRESLGVTPYTRKKLVSLQKKEMFKWFLGNPGSAESSINARLGAGLMILTMEKGKECLLDSPIVVVDTIMRSHYQTVGSGVIELDVPRMCRDFGLPHDFSNEYQQLQPASVRVTGVLVWKHSDLPFFEATTGVPVLSPITSFLPTGAPDSATVSQPTACLEPVSILKQGSPSLLKPPTLVTRIEQTDGEVPRRRQRTTKLHFFAYEDDGSPLNGFSSPRTFASEE